MFTKSKLKIGEVVRVTTSDSDISYIVLNVTQDKVVLLDKGTLGIKELQLPVLRSMGDIVEQPDSFIRELPIKVVSEMLMENTYLALSVNAWDKIFLDAYNSYKEDDKVFMKALSEKSWMLIVGASSIPNNIIENIKDKIS